ncbi:MAG: VWA domain-containing protein [Saprospiraceae bacterium]
MRAFFLLLTILGQLTTLIAQDQAPAPIYFICDASGSMWGQIEGKTKMSIAAEVLTSTRKHLPSDQAVALVAYGHRTKECDDVEFLLEPDASNQEPFREAVSSLKPLGKTPLAFSALEVIERLKQTGEKATIILVTDGIESCGGDLCAVVRAAREAGVPFRLHIVGFGLKPDETEQLRCAAEAGDGSYFDAEDADGLEGVLEEATAAPVVEPDQYVFVYATKNGKPVDANIQAMKPGATRATHGARTYGDTARLYLPPGTWDIVASPLENSDVQPVRLSGITIPAGEVTRLNVSFDGGIFRVTTTNNGEGWDAMVHIYPTGEKRSAAAARTYGRPDDQEVNPGTYDIEMTAMRLEGTGITHRINGLTIAGGETVEVSHDFLSGTVRIGVTSADGLVDALVHFADPATGKNLASGRTYTSDSSNPKTFLLTPGTYKVSVAGLGKHKAGKKTFSLTVNAGETIEHNITF